MRQCFFCPVPALIRPSTCLHPQISLSQSSFLFPLQTLDPWAKPFAIAMTPDIFHLFPCKVNDQVHYQKPYPACFFVFCFGFFFLAEKSQKFFPPSCLSTSPLRMLSLLILHPWSKSSDQCTKLKFFPLPSSDHTCLPNNQREGSSGNGCKQGEWVQP